MPVIQTTYSHKPWIVGSTLKENITSSTPGCIKVQNGSVSLKFVIFINLLKTV